MMGRERESLLFSLLHSLHLHHYVIIVVVQHILSQDQSALRTLMNFNSQPHWGVGK